MEWRNNEGEGKEELNTKNNIEIEIEIDEIEEWCSMIKEERLGAKEGWWNEASEEESKNDGMKEQRRRRKRRIDDTLW